MAAQPNVVVADTTRVDETEQSRTRLVARKLFDGTPLVNAANTLYRRFVRDRADDGAERSTAWIADWLADKSGDDPFFLLVNYLEPHLEYRPPRETTERHLPEGATDEEAMDVPQAPWEFLAGDLDLSERDLPLLRRSTGARSPTSTSSWPRSGPR
jgi:hypothetical protein